MSKATVNDLDRFGMLNESPTDPPLYREVLEQFRPRPDEAVESGPAKPPAAVGKPRKTTRKLRVVADA